MRTRPKLAGRRYWVLAAVTVLGLLWWVPAQAAPILLGFAVAALAREVARATLPQLPPWAVRALSLGYVTLGLMSAAAWEMTPLVPTLAVLILALLVRAGGRDRVARVDRPTGLLSAAAFAERAEAELSRGLRFGRPATLAIIALDGLDDLRAAHGRRAADLALGRIADALRVQSRGYDLLARLWGGHFAALLPETTRDEAEAVTERMRAAIAAIAFIPPGNDKAAPLAATIGLATHTRDGDTVEALLDVAVGRTRHSAQHADPPNVAERVSIPSPASTSSTPVEAGKRQGALPAWPVLAYIGGVCLATAALFAFTFQPIARDSWALLLTLAAVGITARQMRIDLYGRGTISHHFVALMAAAVLLNPTAGIILGAVVGLIAWPIKGRWHKGIFDTGAYGLTIGILAHGYPHLIAILPDIDSTALSLLIHGLTLGGVCYVLNGGLLVGVMAISERANPFALWRERFAWFLPYTLVFGVLATFMGWGGQAFGPLGLVFFAVPAFMLRLATKQYIDHTTESVAALQEAHTKLSQTHHTLLDTVRALEDSYAATLSAFSGMLDARDSETEGHSQRVVAYAVAVGQALKIGPNELAALEVGALLHDVGKVGVSDAILLKNGPLTDEEWAEMRRHPEIGHELTSRIPFLHHASPLVRHHHERWDGCGYPDGLRGEDIPLGARIFAVVDSFDAMISDRPYRKGMPVEAALAQIRRGAGTQFDPQVVEAFLQLASGSGWIPLAQCQQTSGQFSSKRLLLLT